MRDSAIPMQDRMIPAFAEFNIGSSLRRDRIAKRMLKQARGMLTRQIQQESSDTIPVKREADARGRFCWN